MCMGPQIILALVKYNGYVASQNKSLDPTCVDPSALFYLECEVKRFRKGREQEMKAAIMVPIQVDNNPSVSRNVVTALPHFWLKAAPALALFDSACWARVATLLRARWSVLARWRGVTTGASTLRIYHYQSSAHIRHTDTCPDNSPNALLCRH